MKDALGITLTMFILAWMMFFYQGSVDFQVRQQAVGNIVYRYAQTAGKKGILNDTIYQDLGDKLSLYGDYEIQILAEKFNTDGVIALNSDAVINYDLRENNFDILTIYVISKKEHWLDQVIEKSPFGKTDTSRLQYHIIAKSAVYIQ